jgi:hypothetical protein
MLKETSKISYKVNNIISLHEINLDLYISYLESFFKLSFNQEIEKETVCTFLFATYVKDDMSKVSLTDESQNIDDHAVGVACESIISHGLSFYNQVALHPSLWQW